MICAEGKKKRKELKKMIGNKVKIKLAEKSEEINVGIDSRTEY